MKKYRIKPYKSYYRYKQKKYFLKVITGITCIALLIVLIFTIRYFTKNGAQIKVPKVKNQLATNKQGKETLFLQGSGPRYDLYVPPVEVRGIYIPTDEIKNIDQYIDLAEETEINSFIIDMKNDMGYLTFDTHNKTLKEMGSIPNKPPVEDMKTVVEKLYKAGIYPIARIVTFKDNVVGKTHIDRVVKTNTGEIYYTPRDKQMWLDPYNKENWDYIFEICKESIALGFKEIQFDYIRFHESMRQENTSFPKEIGKSEIITQFVEEMVRRLKPYGVYVSADVFGAIITSKIDARTVGQDYAELSQHLDYINPMVYPSHYALGSFGIQYPDLNPYGIILGAMEASEDIHKSLPREDRKAITRPWLQDFTAKWVKPHQVYGGKQLREQIQAVYDAGLKEWILWNAAGNYSKEGLKEE